MQLKPPTKKHKYGAKKCIVTADGTIFETEELKKHDITDIVGIKFDSKMEANYYLHILDRQKAGYYTLTEVHPTFILQDKPKIKYIADFMITYPSGEVKVIDVKGTRTTAFNLKVRLFQAKHPQLKLVLATGTHNNWKYTEVS